MRTRRDYIAEEYLIYFFTGELDKIIERLKLKIDLKLPDSVYCSISAYQFQKVYQSQGGGHSDPTGNTAVKIADFYLARKRQYNYHLELKKSISEIIDQYNYKDVELFKTYIIDGNLSAKSKEIGIYYGKARRRVYELNNIILDKVQKLFYNNIFTEEVYL